VSNITYLGNVHSIYTPKVASRTTYACCHSHLQTGELRKAAPMVSMNDHIEMNDTRQCSRSCQATEQPWAANNSVKSNKSGGRATRAQRSAQSGHLNM